MTGAESDGAYEYPRLRPVEAFPAEIRGKQVMALRDPLNYAEGVVFFPLETASLLGLFDGSHSWLDIQAAFARRFGSLLFREDLLAIIQTLDDHLLLESPRFAAHRAAVDEAFRRSPVRPAMLAGKSFPREPEALRSQLEGYFAAAEGPGSTPPSPAAAGLTGLVVPHIDFLRGGPCYAWGYRELEGAPPADRWVILGTVHLPIGRAFALTRKNFETPLGDVETDQEFLDHLVAKAGSEYFADESAHRGEHSIEFQAVFLRHWTPPGRAVRIVPILCGSLHEFVEQRRSPKEGQEIETFVAALRDSLARCGGRTLLLASADLAHVGPRFGDAYPVTPGQLREIADADRDMLGAVETGDAEAFFRAVARDGDRRRICGLPPIYTALRVLEGSWGRVLRYSQSPHRQGTVTFAAVALYA